MKCQAIGCEEDAGYVYRYEGSHRMPAVEVSLCIGHFLDCWCYPENKSCSQEKDTGSDMTK